MNSTASSFLDSTALLPNGAALRERAERDGYLFFKGLLPAEDVLRVRSDVLRVRSDVLRVIEDYGWRRAGQGALGGVIDVAALNEVPDELMRLDIGVSSAAYNDVQRLESVHLLPHHPRLLALYETLFERDVLVHPRHIVRLITSHQGMVPTPQHQDFPLIQGTRGTWTCWFPVGDCPLEMGGLTVLRGSNQLGPLPIQSSKGAGNTQAQLCPWENDWVKGGYEAGDVLTFPSLTVHKGMPSQLKEQIRISFDVRYQPADEPIEIKSLHPHCGLEWEEIYQGWESRDLQWYWERERLEMEEWDASLVTPGRRIC